jgi:hypothetical protein
MTANSLIFLTGIPLNAVARCRAVTTVMPSLCLFGTQLGVSHRHFHSATPNSDRLLLIPPQAPLLQVLFIAD